MDSAGQPDEVRPGPRMADEELVGQQIALEAVAAVAGGDDVARRVGAAVCEWIDVIEGREPELERPGAVDAAPAAVAHGCALEGALGLKRDNAATATKAAW